MTVNTQAHSKFNNEDNKLDFSCILKSLSRMTHWHWLIRKFLSNQKFQGFFSHQWYKGKGKRLPRVYPYADDKGISEHVNS